MGAQGIVSILLTAKDQASAVVAKTTTYLRNLAAGTRDASKQFGGFGKAIKGASFDLNSITNKIGELAALGGVAVLLKKAAAAADEFAASQRALAGAAKLTGAPLDFVTDLARQGRENFSLSGTEANKFATELTTLAAKTGDLSQAQKGLNNFLNLGAAQGLKAAETLELLERAANGDERAIKKFVNLKPDQVFERFATSVGKSADQLTDAEKAQAIFNIAAEKGALVQGAFNNLAKTTQGAVNKAKDAVHDMAVEIGTALGPAIKFAAELIQGLVLNVQTFIRSFQRGVGDLALLNIEMKAGLNGLLASVVDFFTTLVEVVPRSWLKVLGLDTLPGDLSKVAAKLRAESAKLQGIADEARADLEAEIFPEASGFSKKALTAAETKIQTEIKLAEAAKKKAEASKNAQAALEAELQLIDLKIKADKDTIADRTRLGEIEDDIHEKMKQKNLTTLEAIKLEQALLNIQQIRQGITDKNLGTSLSPRGNRLAGDAGALGNSGTQGDVPGFLQGQRPEGIPAATQQKVATLSQELMAVMVDSVSEPLEGFFNKLITGFDSVGDAVKGFGASVAQAFAAIAAQKFASGLLGALKFADGGLVTGPGGPKSDSILAALSNGEGVLTAKAVASIGGKAGLDYLNSLNGPRSASIPRFADGGVAGAASEGGSLNGSITVGLGEGLVLSQLDTPAGQRGLIKIIGKSKNAMNGVLGR